MADGLLCFVEAKFTSGNETSPKRTGNPMRYETGGIRRDAHLVVSRPLQE